MIEQINQMQTAADRNAGNLTDYIPYKKKLINFCHSYTYSSI
jgi:hypothetical protein